MPINPNEELTPETSQEAFTARTYDPMQPVPEEAETNMEAYIKYLYDKTQRLPEKPDTREEYFMMIAGQNIGPGSEVEPLTVTANGTYSEAGKAYSPVTVNVPLPTNANERKSITSYPVTDSANYPLPKCDVTVTDADKCEVIVTTDNTITEDSGVYIERQSGGGNRELDAIVGGSIVWNQKVDKDNFRSSSVTDVTLTNNGDGTLTVDILNTISTLKEVYITPNSSVYYFKIPVNHVFAMLDTKIISGVNYRNGYNGTTMRTNSLLKQPPSSSGNILLGVELLANMQPQTFTIQPIIIDITQMFGTVIADYIYSLEQSTAGSGIAWLKSYGYLTDDYYGYTANKIESVSVARHKMVGFNQWDEQWEVGTLNTFNGEPASNNNHFRTKNFIEVNPGVEYYMKTGENNTFLLLYFADKSYHDYIHPVNQTIRLREDIRYVKFVVTTTNTYNNDICINISNPSKNGTYEPYEEHTYPINPITLRGIPKLNVSNQLYYDGDRYEASGRVTRKLGRIVFDGTQEDTEFSFYSADGQNRITWTKFENLGKKGTKDFVSNQLIASVNYNALPPDWTVANSGDNVTRCFIGVPSTITSVSDWQAYVTSNPIVLEYELATPTYEDSSPFEPNQIVDANGTEEYIDAGVEAGARDVAIPVGHDTKYFNGKAYVKPLTAGTSDTVSMADMGIMPTSPMYINANGLVDVEYWKSNS